MAKREEDPDGSGSKDRDQAATPPGSNVADFRRERTYRLEKSGIDPEKFYTRAHDDVGHSDWFKVRVPPKLHDRVMRHVGKRSKFGYTSVSAAVRDALTHRLDFIDERYGDEEEHTHWQNYLADQDWNETVAAEQHARRWVQEAREQMDSIVFDYTERNQLSVALEKLRYWLERLPGYEEAHHVYIQQYILAKMAEVRQAILDQRSASSRS